MKAFNCSLCNTPSSDNFFTDKCRPYYYCPNCEMIFVSPEFYISEKQEKSRYDLHQNNSDDPGYRKMLTKMLDPMLIRIKTGDKGLDFGSGPGPTLSKMFEELGFDINIYDHFYANNPKILEEQYEFITTTEVVEHLYKPKKTLDMLWSILNPGGTLGVMTKISTGKVTFPKWHYKNDATHVCFFSKKSFNLLAQEWDANIEFIGNDIILFSKPFLT